jgi:hypothetical protein
MQPLEPLDAIQRRLWRLVTDPDGVESARAASGDPSGARLGELLRADRGLSAVARLSVYANAYLVRIRACLREDFPALAAVLGEAAFHDLVQTYLMMHPPERPSLRHAGARLAAHLRTPPFAAIFASRAPFAAELAALEWAIVDAFHAPDRAALGREALAQVPLDAWPSLRLELTPSLRVLRGEWPVQLVRERFDRDGGMPDAAPRAPTQLRVWRCDEAVRHRAVDGLEADALERAARGETFGAICDGAAVEVGEGEASRAAAQWLADWVADGLVVGVRVEPDAGSC